jgi:membrane-bound PQQ-dependent dehydrogenase (glucose/quinate/shikimate family)
MASANRSARKFICCLAACVAACCLALPPSSADQRRDWRYWGGDAGGARFAPLKQIHRGNVAKLQRAWTYHTGEWELLDEAQRKKPPTFEATPLVVGGLLYVSTPTGRVIALKADTGQEVWKFDPQAARTGFRAPQRQRGVSYWESADGKEKRIFSGTSDGRLVALDALTGTPCAAFGKGGAIDLRDHDDAKWKGAAFYEITSPPAIFKDLVITGSRLPEYPAKGPGGSVRAFEARTGRLVWQFNTVPRPGETGHETWAAESWRDRTGANVWSVMSVDAERGLVFLPIGSPSYDFYGGDRKGMNLFGNSLVALEAATGRLVWYFQMVHHDIWDYDLPAQPVLITVRRNGRAIPAVAQVTKMGFVFILDRVTGKPLFPVEERPFPQSEVPGEETWPTQPIPLRPPALARRGITRGELSEVTPESKKYCAELFDSLVNTTLYTPTGLKPTLKFPGYLGGGNWSGASFDAASGLLYVNVNELGDIGVMRPEKPDAPTPFRRNSDLDMGGYARFWDENFWPCQRPPWGTLSAVDVNKGEIVWQTPLGITEELVAKGLEKTGRPNLGGSLVTAGGLVFIGASNDSRFRAFDAKTGKELWVAKLEASAHAAPMTYEINGKQYVVVAAGGAGYFNKNFSDTVAAFALPSP